MLSGSLSHRPSDGPNLSSQTSAPSCCGHQGVGHPQQSRLNTLFGKNTSIEKITAHHARTRTRQLLQVKAARKLPIQRFLSEGKPFVEIVRMARSEKVDLIVMGSYGGQTGDVARIFFGSTAEQVVRTANCAVLCVPFPLAKQKDSNNTVS